MPFRDPLPLDVLKYIARQRKADPDVQALLWEVKRLQSFVARQHQFSTTQQPWGPLIAKLWDELGQDILKEPCVQSMVKSQDRLINP